MPKDKRKRGRHAAGRAASVDDDDNASVLSDKTDSTLHLSDDDGITEEEKHEAKIKEGIDLATEKSVQTRTNALISLRDDLQKRLMTGFLLNHHQTMADLIERSLKKGKAGEQIAAAKLASTLCISLLGTSEVEAVYEALTPLLVVIIQDPATAPQARQEVAQTLALLAFLACPEPSDLPSTMNVLHKVFCAALPKGNGELPKHPPAVVAVLISALQGVCLLLTLLPNSTVYTMASKLLEELLPVLESSEVDLRIMIGEAISLVYEIARSYASDFRWRRQNELKKILSDLATDSHKYRGKKERKHQRASFREVMASIIDGDDLIETITVGPKHHRQELTLHSWCLRFQYQALCHALDLGLNMHMTWNQAVRDLFDLGPTPVPAASMLLNRHGVKTPNHESPAVKARSVARSKNRDMRAAALAYDDD